MRVEVLEGLEELGTNLCCTHAGERIKRLSQVGHAAPIHVGAAREPSLAGLMPCWLRRRRGRAESARGAPDRTSRPV
ncbi:hypothetical protein Dac01nite_01270 [Demequina activiva]|uniref:Uncharacterized protein n=1 Tax=Demequina activiva TaxID=1582364 RepID=A0A919Q3U4_9MICO|nr:hypothetical protein Dac01nite_01270 [Demequina activiva]